jgi:hypothetical protein
MHFTLYFRTKGVFYLRATISNYFISLLLSQLYLFFKYSQLYLAPQIWYFVSIIMLWRWTNCYRLIKDASDFYMHEEASNGLHAQNFRLDGTEWHFKYHLNHRKTAFIPSFRWWIQIYLVLIPTAVIQNENLHCIRSVTPALGGHLMFTLYTFGRSAKGRQATRCCWFSSKIRLQVWKNHDVIHDVYHKRVKSQYESICTPGYMKKKVDTSIENNPHFQLHFFLRLCSFYVAENTKNFTFRFYTLVGYIINYVCNLFKNWNL